MALTPVAGEFLPCPLPHRGPSFFGWAEEVRWVEDDCFPLDVSARVESIDVFFLPESLSFFSAGLFSRRHLESMSRVLAGDCNDALASALMAFLTASSQESRSLPRASNWTRIESFRPSQKYRIMISSLGVAIGSNSWRTASRCSRYAAQSRTFFSRCWTSCLIFP